VGKEEQGKRIFEKMKGGREEDVEDVKGFGNGLLSSSLEEEHIGTEKEASTPGRKEIT